MYVKNKMINNKLKYQILRNKEYLAKITQFVKVSHKLIPLLK